MCRFSHAPRRFVLFWSAIAVLQFAQPVGSCPSASASISVTATVIEPVGLVETESANRAPSLVLYCPREGHVSCAVAFVAHLERLKTENPLEIRRPEIVRILTGAVASAYTAEELLRGGSSSDSCCVITLAYTEN